MATVQPFRALRYQPSRINGVLEAVLAPPYDVISLEQQEALYRRSPHNCVRMILSRQYDGDSPTDNRYTRAAKRLQEWLSEGILAEDPEPAYYMYEQTYSISAGYPPRQQTFTRRGVFLALKLEPFGQGCVFPHEETFSSPKADRLNLFRACRANFSPVFGLVPDSDTAVTGLLARAAQELPPAAVVDEGQGVRSRLWRLTQGQHAAYVAELTRLLAPRKVFIADGHHRYETACNYRQERRASDSAPQIPGDRPYDFVLMVCVPMSDPGLFILPTHRLVNAGAGFTPGRFLEQVAAWFEIQDASEGQLAGLAEDSAGALRFGLLLAGGGKKLLTAKPELDAAMLKAAPDKSAGWRGLDTAVLQELILKGLLNLSVDKHSSKEGIVYTKDVREAFAQLATPGTFHLGFILRPTRIEQVREVAEQGERMPQKSTYFYPKLISGLVMRRL